MWYLVLSHTQPDKKGNIQQDHEIEHKEWLDDQHRQGKVLFSGPSSDRDYGIYIMLASNQSEAKHLAAQDPHHIRGIRTMQVFEWDLRRAFRLDGATIADVEQMAGQR